VIRALARQKGRAGRASDADQFIVAHQIERFFAVLTDKKIRRASIGA